MDPNRKDLKTVEGQAVIAWGLAAVIMPFIVAVVHSADFATLGFIIDAALLWLFQTYVFNLPDDWTDTDEAAALIGTLAIVVVWAASLALLIAGI